MSSWRLSASSPPYLRFLLTYVCALDLDLTLDLARDSPRRVGLGLHDHQLVGAEDSGGAAGQPHARAKGTDAQEELDIENMQQFYMWFQSLEAEANQLAFDPYSCVRRSCRHAMLHCSAIDRIPSIHPWRMAACRSVYLRQISEYAGECERILQEIDASLEALTMLEEQHVTVLTKTGELHQACEELFAQQVRAPGSCRPHAICWLTQSTRACVSLSR